MTTNNALKLKEKIGIVCIIIIGFALMLYTHLSSPSISSLCGTIVIGTYLSLIFTVLVERHYSGSK